MDNDNYKTKIAEYKIMINKSDSNLNKYLKELGAIYEKINMFYEAIVECYIKIIQIEPDNLTIINQIGVCYFNLSQFKLAIHYFKKVIKIKEHPDVCNNLSNCYANIKDYQSAEKILLISYGLDKNNNTTKSSLLQLYYYMKKYDESINIFKKIKNPEDKQKYNISFVYLAKKQFQKGFGLYETRLHHNNINVQTGLKDRVDIPNIKYWDGKQPCKNLLVVYEQGIGDNIQYYRFIVELANKYPNMQIYYFCKDIISRLFKIHTNINIISTIILTNYDNYVYIMSLPKLMNITNICPNITNYIHTNNDKMNYWVNTFSSLKRFKVGFVYNGLLSSFIEKYIPLIDFECLCELNIDLICIHRKNDIEKDINTISQKFKDNLHFFDIDNNSEPFEDTICILQNIDLLITIDTFIVHLAGILDVKTWLLLGKYSEWRWSDDKKLTYWYNSVELMRVEEEIDLKNILSSVKTKLSFLIDNISSKV